MLFALYVNGVAAFQQDLADGYDAQTQFLIMLDDGRQSINDILAVVVKQHDTAVFNLARNPLANTIGCGVVFPVKRIPTGNSWKRTI